MNSKRNKTLITPFQYDLLCKKEGITIINGKLCVDINMVMQPITPQKSETGIMELDQMELSDVRRAVEKLKRLVPILTDYDVVWEYSSDAFNIGTKARLRICDELECGEVDYILLHTRVDDEPKDVFLSCDTEIGISVYGKKMGDVIKLRENLTTIEILYIYKSLDDVYQPELEGKKTK